MNEQAIRRKRCINGHNVSKWGRNPYNRCCLKCGRANARKYAIKHRKERAVYNKEWFLNNQNWYKDQYHRVRKHVLWSIKYSNPCFDCKEWFNPWQMEFDHLPQFKKHFSLGAGLLLNAKVIEELRKCQLVCDRTYKRTYL